MYVTLNKIKKHLNIDEDFTDDDSYLTDLEQVAETVVERHIDSSFDNIIEGENLPSPLEQAILLFIGNMYLNRESVAFATTQQIPFSYQYLIDLYTDYTKKV